MATLLLHAVAAVVLLAPVGARAACGPVIMEQSFDKYKSPQTYRMSNVLQDFPRVQTGDSMKVNHCTVEDGRLVAHYPKGQILGDDSGCTWFTAFSQVQSEVTLRYDVYFEPGFEWTAGGKLPGLCGGSCARGCNTQAASDGWSARLMWREGGAITLYAYYPGMIMGGCGVDFFWSKKFTTGRWHQIKLYVKMNTPGVRNGVVRGYLNGELALARDNFLWRGSNSVGKAMIANAYITTYVGGSVYSLFAPHRDQWIMFDSFKAWAGFCPPVGPQGPKPAPKPAPKPGPKPGPAPKPPGAVCSARFSRCGGLGYNGPRCCREGAKCFYANKFYSQCL